MGSLTRLSAHEMAEQVRARKLSAADLVEVHLGRIERFNPKLNAIIALDAERARAAARQVDAAVAQGQSAGPLAGVPLTIKSAIDVAGLRCETGTQARAGNVAAADAPLVARLRAAGAVILGVSNVAEFLMAYESDNPLYGRTNNPWDLERTPGGSSGGESAAIAACLSAGGVGSDGGGSIRVPAHFAGICGLKPTPGRIPQTGHFPAGAGPFAHLGVVGPMARTVTDLQLLFEAMAGPVWEDPAAAPVPVRHWSDEELKRLRIGWFDELPHTQATAETRHAVQGAAQTLTRAGFAVEPFRPAGLEDAIRVWGVFFGDGCRMLLAPLLHGHEAELPILKEYLAATAGRPPLTADSLMAALLERDAVRNRLLAQMERYPILLLPVAAVPAFRHGERAWTFNGQTVRYLDAMSYTVWCNILGFPAAVVPFGTSLEALPIGVQIVGRPFEDEAVLAVAAHIERANKGWQAPPGFDIE